MEFVTQADYDKIKQKLEDLIAQRPAISKRIAEARALGDLKENAEYHAARDDQGLAEAEIRRLTERLKNIQISDGSEVPDDMLEQALVAEAGA